MKGSIRRQIRPLWILFSSRWGGSEQIAISDLVDFARNGMPVSLLCLEGSPLHASASRFPEIHVRTLSAKPKRIDWEFVNTIREFIIADDINILHIKDESLLWSIVPALWDHPEVSLIASRYASVESKFTKWLQAPLFSRVDYLTVLSENLMSSVLKKRPIRERKIKVINLGLDLTKFDPAKISGSTMREQWGADKDTLVVGSVGRLDPEVGQETFLKAAAGLMKYKDRKIKFVVVGEDPLSDADEYVAKLKELVHQFHLEDAVTFCSLADNLPEIMAGFDVFVMPGREEVPGLGALEALAMERPVVLSRVAGAEEIAGRNFEHGLLVRAEDAFDLQQRILYLLDNPSLRMTMGVNGRKYVLRHYDKRIRFLRTAEVYERCMKRRFAHSGELDLD